MPAWNHTNIWTDDYYEAYRRFVKSKAHLLKGGTEDCADLSMSLIIDFAEQNGLPLTFTDDRNLQYSSKRDGQWPSAGLNVEYSIIPVPTGGVTVDASGGPVWETGLLKIPQQFDYYFGDNCVWKNKGEYYAAVKRRIGASALFSKNTEPISTAPRSGDLLLSKGHAAIVMDAYLPGLPHPKAADSSIESWVNPETAAKEVHVLEYFRDNHGVINEENKTKAHFDYLNHRGEKKPKAELIYYRRVEDAVADGFSFRRYNSSVLR
jgi:hypothetical protein